MGVAGHPYVKEGFHYALILKIFFVKNILEKNKAKKVIEQYIKFKQLLISAIW
jgi:hypothetical protein